MNQQSNFSNITNQQSSPFGVNKSMGNYYGFMERSSNQISKAETEKIDSNVKESSLDTKSKKNISSEKEVLILDDVIILDDKAPEITSEDFKISDNDSISLVSKSIAIETGDKAVETENLSHDFSIIEISTPKKKRKISHDYLSNTPTLLVPDSKNDYIWQEGFVQGLFYSMGVDSPFGPAGDNDINRQFLDGFKTASNYFSHKLEEKK